MATLDSTISGETANSYVDVAYADTYFSNHFNTVKAASWAALTSNQKAQLLIQACWDLEQFKYTEPIDRTHSIVQGRLQWDSRLGRFTAYVPVSSSPVQYSVYQALQFPRNLDLRTTGFTYIPERMQMAQCEQAIYIANFDETALSNRLQGVNLDKVSVGDIATTQEYMYQGSMLSPLAAEFIRPFLFRTKRLRRS